MDFYRFYGGKRVEHWDSADQLGLIRQLGVSRTPLIHLRAITR
ncbi:putative SnoaL-like aldol condensation-catalyzing enzyme [Methanolinea mesophila]|nr:ester cyclase [Methanolinea mesophila]MBP1927573.1 putative SnoaL-like aldol condensation-catalyzing enzyme [Methanolinea mesophila]